MSDIIDTLRRAEAHIREVAGRATEGPWWARHYGDGTYVQHADGGIAARARRADAAHIALWDPTVALAVADWLKVAAADAWAHGICECADGCHECDDDLHAPHVRAALALARLVLGEEG